MREVHRFLFILLATKKLEIAKLSLDGHNSVKELANRFGISPNVLYYWRSQYYRHKEDSFSGNGNKIMSDSEREVALLRELREVRLEKDILRKAESIFSKSDKRFTSL